jgi:hypothetical protein
MADFAANATGAQDVTGTLPVFTDTSPYGSGNDQGYVIADFTSRTFTLKDSAGNLIAVLDLGSNLSVTYPITKDQFIVATLTLQGVGTFTKEIKLPFNRITLNAYRNALADAGCSCSCNGQSELNDADRFLRGAEIEGPAGNGAAFDSDISAAYAYLINGSN